MGAVVVNPNSTNHAFNERHRKAFAQVVSDLGQAYKTVQFPSPLATGDLVLSVRKVDRPDTSKWGTMVLLLKLDDNPEWQNISDDAEPDGPLTFRVYTQRRVPPAKIMTDGLTWTLSEDDLNNFAREIRETLE